MKIKTNLQRFFLFGVVLTLSAAAIMGIIAIIVGTLDPFWAKVLGTTLVIASTSLVGLACATTHAHGAARPTGLLGIAATGAGLALMLFWIWAEYREAWLEKLIITFWLFAVSLALSGLLAHAKLRPGWFQWVRRITWAAIAVLVILSCIEIWGKTQNEILIKASQISGIIAVFGTISVPILWRITAISEASKPPPSVGSDRIELSCPRCEAHLQLPPGKSRCSECGLRFRIELSE